MLYFQTSAPNYKTVVVVMTQKKTFAVLLDLGQKEESLTEKEIRIFTGVDNRNYPIIYS